MLIHQERSFAVIFRFSECVFDVDVERTRAYYTQDDYRLCGCQNCRNYDQAILTVPDAVLDFLRSLGIDPRKPTEVYSVNEELEEDGTLRYNGWYHVCGTPVEWTETTSETVAENGVRILQHRMDLAYSPAPDYPFSILPVKNTVMLPKGFPTPALQLEIDVRLPWVLPDPYRL